MVSASKLIRLTRTCIMPSAMMHSQLVAEISPELSAHKGGTDVNPGFLRRQSQRHRPHHEDIGIGHALRLGTVVAIHTQRLEQQPAGHGDAGVARTQILVGTIEDRRDAALAGAILHPQSWQSRKPGSLLRLIVELESVLRIVFGPIARIGNRYRLLHEGMVAGVSALPALVALLEYLARLRQQRLRRVIRKHDAERVLVVDWYPGMSAQIRKRRQRRHQRVERHQELIDAPVQRVLVEVPAGRNAHPEILLDAFEGGTEVALLNPRT